MCTCLSVMWESCSFFFFFFTKIYANKKPQLPEVCIVPFQRCQ